MEFVKTGQGDTDDATPASNNGLETRSSPSRGSWYNSRELNEWARDIADWRQRKEFETSWDNMMEKLMLAVTELGEAAEAYRKEDKVNFAEEVIDTMIRLWDIAGSVGIDVEKELGDKMMYNESRPTKHGKKC